MCSNRLAHPLDATLPGMPPVPSGSPMAEGGEEKERRKRDRKLPNEKRGPHTGMGAENSPTEKGNGKLTKARGPRSEICPGENGGR